MVYFNQNQSPKANFLSISGYEKLVVTATFEAYRSPLQSSLVKPTEKNYS